MKKSLVWMAGRMLLWLVPVFFVWKLTVSSVLVPMAMVTSNLWFEPAYSRMGATLSIDQQSTQWHIENNLFVATQAWPNNSYQPSLVVNEQTRVTLENISSGYTLGFPLLWLLILLMSRHKMKHLLYGSLMQFAVVVVALGIFLVFRMTDMLLGEKLLRIAAPGHYILVPDIPPTWLPRLLKPLLDISGYIAFLIAPVVISVYLCRSFILGQWLAAQLDATMVRVGNLPDPVTAGRNK